MTDSRIVPVKQLEQRFSALARDVRRLKAGGLSSAAYREYLPPMTGVTLGSGVLIGEYRYRIPRECHFMMKFTLGAGSDVTANIDITLPLEAARNDQHPITAICYDPAAGVRNLVAFMFNTTTVRLMATGAGDLATAITTTVPFDWNAVADANFSMGVVYQTME